MLAIYRKTSKSSRLESKQDIQKGDWLNIVSPSAKEVRLLHKDFGIPLEFIHASLDVNERPRIDEFKDIKLIILRAPVKNDGVYHIMPIGIVITESLFITISGLPSQVIAEFEQDKVSEFCTTKRIRFLLQIIKVINKYFDIYVEEFHTLTSKLESELLSSQKNQQVIEFLETQKTATYFHTAVTNNGTLFEKLITHKKLDVFSEDKELLEDMIVENKEITETLTIFINNLSNTMDAYASIISNNLNITMKFLTSLTIILTIPTIITSFYGMNIRLPLQQNPLAYLYLIIVIILLLIISVYFFSKKDWL